MDRLHGIRRFAELLGQKYEYLPPGILLRGADCGLGLGRPLKAVSGARIAMERVWDVEPRELGVEPVGILGRGFLVLVAEETDDRAGEAPKLRERRCAIAPGFEHAGWVAGDRAGKIRHRTGRHEQNVTAHAMPGDGEAVLRDVHPGFQVC